MIECPGCGALVEADDRRRIRERQLVSSDTRRDWVLHDSLCIRDPLGTVIWCRVAGPTDDLLHAHVHEATAMIAAQLDCTVAQALEVLRVCARSLRQSVDFTALDVIDEEIRFDVEREDDSSVALS